MLTQRWGIYWRMFRFAFDRWPLVVICTMKLHNLCVDRAVDVPLQRYEHDVLDGDLWEVNDNTRESDVDLRGRAVGDRRRQITAYLENHGILRPVHAMVNSRC